jgi:prophage antirepressor-like protein
MELFNYNNIDVRFQKTKDDKILFCAKDICKILELKNVSESCKKLNANQITTISLSDSGGRPFKNIYVTESGVYKLIFKSRKEEAVIFANYVCEEILPCIREHGCYPYIKPEIHKTITQNNQININNENDLHYKVIKFIRKHTKLLITATLGENQDTSRKRIDSYNKGYSKGMPDIVIFDSTKKYHAFCIELKNPNGNGVISKSQMTIMDKFKLLGYNTLISNDYDEIIINIFNYWEETQFVKRMKCNKCNKSFANNNTLEKHKKKYHS